MSSELAGEVLTYPGRKNLIQSIIGRLNEERKLELSQNEADRFLMDLKIGEGTFNQQQFQIFKKHFELKKRAILAGVIFEVDDKLGNAYRKVSRKHLVGSSDIEAAYAPVHAVLKKFEPKLA